eukprot:6181096-Pleurochrysis_carterae.AAC.2
MLESITSTFSCLQTLAAIDSARLSAEFRILDSVLPGSVVCSVESRHASQRQARKLPQSRPMMLRSSVKRSKGKLSLCIQQRPVALKMQNVKTRHVSLGDRIGARHLFPGQQVEQLGNGACSSVYEALSALQVVSGIASNECIGNQSISWDQECEISLLVEMLKLQQ